MDAKLLNAAGIHLRRADPILGTLIDSQVLQPLEQRGGFFASLCRSIVGQQVSVAAAKAIFLRLEAATGLVPLEVSQLSDTDIKTIGLSKQKASYITDLAVHFTKNPDIYNHLEQQNDEEIIAELTDVKGIGKWTAQMFLIFTLARPDVFAPDDVGLMRAMTLLYKWDKLPSKQYLEELSSSWKPYRTVASLHLWQSLNNTP